MIFRLVCPFECLVLMILIMTNYLENLPKDSTVEPHNTGSRGTDNLFLLLEDICNYQYMKKMKPHSRVKKTASIIGGIMFLAGPV